jgi:hypothetical protein
VDPITLGIIGSSAVAVITGLITWAIKTLITNVGEQRDRLNKYEAKVDGVVADNKELKTTIAGIHNSLAKYNSETHNAILTLTNHMAEMNTNVEVIRTKLDHIRKD